MHVAAYLSSQLDPELRVALGIYRRRVFIERLGWSLTAPDGLEFDQFDGLRTVYLIAREPDGAIVGCARLLPTTGPYLLRCVFAQLLDGAPAPDSAAIMELSRFAAMDLRRSQGSQLESATLASELMNAVLHYARERSVSSLVAVSSRSVQALLRRAGFHAHRGRVSERFDGHWINACWIPTQQLMPGFTGRYQRVVAYGAHA